MREAVRSSGTLETSIRLHGVTPQMIILFTVGFCSPDNVEELMSEVFWKIGTADTRGKEEDGQREMKMGSLKCAVNT
jgi:hypothetical protein